MLLNCLAILYCILTADVWLIVNPCMFKWLRSKDLHPPLSNNNVFLYISVLTFQENTVSNTLLQHYIKCSIYTLSFLPVEFRCLNLSLIPFDFFSFSPVSLIVEFFLFLFAVIDSRNCTVIGISSFNSARKLSRAKFEISDGLFLSNFKQLSLL